MNQKLGFALLLAYLLSAPASATPTITVGTWGPYVPGATGVQIQILVSGGDPVEGLNFRLAIGDETGPDLPIITSVDIVGPGTIFHDNNTGQVDAGFPPPGFATNSTTTTTAENTRTQGVG